MTFGEKLSKLRRENNYTQENLADILGVSRQTVSKWEQNAAYPETDKLIRISELFNCSLDRLLKNSEMTNGVQNGENTYMPLTKALGLKEKKSEKTVFGKPLWHVAKNARGFIAVGLSAKGVIAIGLKARGLISIGVLSMGLLSFGTLSLGILSAGLFSLGILSAGCFAAGVFATGAISLGIISVGAISFGDFSAGALARGKYIALGDDAKAMIALGNSKAAGSLFQSADRFGSSADTSHIISLLNSVVPRFLGWAKDIFAFLFL